MFIYLGDIFAKASSVIKLTNDLFDEPNPPKKGCA